jgi:hypothetical protein
MLSNIGTIEINEELDTVSMVCEDGTHARFLATSECCSTSSFELMQEFDWKGGVPLLKWTDLIGQQVVKVQRVHSFEGEEYEYSKRHIYMVHCRSDAKFGFILCNFSNGYYDGDVSFQLCLPAIVANPDDSRTIVTIVAGLPGSGKSCYARALAKTCGKTYVFDDKDIPNVDAYVLSALLSNGKSVIVVNARYCEHTLNEIMQLPWVSTIRELGYPVRLHCFEADLERCSANLNNLIILMPEEAKKKKSWYSSKSALHNARARSESLYKLHPRWEACLAAECDYPILRLPCYSTDK